MNTNHTHGSDFELRLRTLSADDCPRSEHQDTVRQRVLSAFDRALQARNEKLRGHRSVIFRKVVIKWPILRYAVAASILLAALAWFFRPATNTAALAFGRIVETVVSARTARFNVEVRIEGQPSQSAKVIFMAPAKYRMEFEKQLNISDFEAAKLLTFIPAQKRAVVFNLKNAPKDRVPENQFEQLRRLLRDERHKAPAYEKLGEKTINGRKALGFRLESGIGNTTLWGDPKTGEPILIETLYSGIPKTQAIMSQFEMNVELQPELFAMDIPDGYKSQSFDIDASTPTETTFVESLRVCAELSGGVFPDALDTQSVTKLMISTMLKEGKPKDEDVQKLMDEAIKIGRGFQFALSLPATAQAHYAGKGIKKETKDRPIFWYLPEGSKRYRVIDATLTVDDTDEAPRIEGAVPLIRKAATDGSLRP
jgi:outer membrane lipoprotein-sorting protein